MEWVTVETFSWSRCLFRGVLRGCGSWGYEGAEAALGGGASGIRSWNWRPAVAFRDLIVCMGERSGEVGIRWWARRQGRSPRLCGEVVHSLRGGGWWWGKNLGMNWGYRVGMSVLDGGEVSKRLCFLDHGMCEELWSDGNEVRWVWLMLGGHVVFLLGVPSSPVVLIAGEDEVRSFILESCQ